MTTVVPARPPPPLRPELNNKYPSGSDPDGDSLFPSLLVTPPMRLSYPRMAPMGRSASPRARIGNEQFRSESVTVKVVWSARLCSTEAYADREQIVRPWVSIDTSNGVVSHNQDLAGLQLWGCVLEQFRPYVVARRTGLSNVMSLNGNNSTGTATVNWTPIRAPRSMV